MTVHCATHGVTPKMPQRLIDDPIVAAAEDQRGQLRRPPARCVDVVEGARGPVARLAVVGHPPEELRHALDRVSSTTPRRRAASRGCGAPRTRRSRRRPRTTGGARRSPRTRAPRGIWRAPDQHEPSQLALELGHAQQVHAAGRMTDEDRLVARLDGLEQHARPQLTDPDRRRCSSPARRARRRARGGSRREMPGPPGKNNQSGPTPARRLRSHTSERVSGMTRNVACPRSGRVSEIRPDAGQARGGVLVEQRGRARAANDAYDLVCDFGNEVVRRNSRPSSIHFTRSARSIVRRTLPASSRWLSCAIS